ncbi:MAG: extracellular solute-binding protein [Treponema sp.]|nr:extracellular solute-binding protein [Treponema sp.]
MKRIFCIFAAAAIAALTGCGANGGAKGGANSGGERAGEITVSAYETMRFRDFLEEAAREFEERNPGTAIKVDTFSAMPEIRLDGNGNVIVDIQDDPQSRADYISRVNTGLMSGNGADLYAIDVLPLYKFVGNGSLENLEPYMAGDPGFKREDYRGNILEALRYKDGVWFLPLDYSFNYYAYDTTLVPPETARRFGPDKAWSAGELLALGETLYTGEYKIFSSSASALGQQLLNEQIARFVDLENKKANFLDGAFTGMFNSLRVYEESGYILPEASRAGGDSGGVMPQAVPTDRSFFKLNQSASLINQFTRGAGKRMIGRGASGAVTDDDEIAGIAALADGVVPFSYDKAFGLNARSENKALAWAFLKHLLAKESQLSSSSRSEGFSLPLHNEARAERAEMLLAGAFMIRGGEPLTGQARERLNLLQKTVETLSDKINGFTLRDSAIDDMIRAETRAFFSGSRAPDEAARILQNKADLYLNE